MNRGSGKYEVCPEASICGQCWGSNPRPCDVELNALSTWLYALKIMKSLFHGLGKGMMRHKPHTHYVCLKCRNASPMLVHVCDSVDSKGQACYFKVTVTMQGHKCSKFHFISTEKKVPMSYSEPPRLLDHQGGLQ